MLKTLSLWAMLVHEYLLYKKKQFPGYALCKSCSYKFHNIHRKKLVPES